MSRGADRPVEMPGHRSDIPTPSPRRLLVTIDTEGDNLWANPRRITTRNTAFLPRFQAICERYALAPSWLVNYEMVSDPTFVEFGRDVLARAAGEIGCHPHAWNTPPIHPLTRDDYAFTPYLTEYPDSIIAAKLRTLTDLLESTFDRKVVSHRAGRWAFNDSYAKALVGLGYRVDCSVTPGIDWRTVPGNPAGDGGTDYTDALRGAYRLSAKSDSGAILWELPMTIRPAGRSVAATIRRALRTITPARKIWNRLYPAVRWLRPRPGNRNDMLRLLQDVAVEGAPYAEFMLHSSELMPGGSPTFRDERAIDLLYDDLEALFEQARSLGYLGVTLQAYADELDRSVTSTA